MPRNHKIPNFIAEVRRSRGKTQQELADYLGVNLTTINRYENGTRGMSPDAIERAAVFLNVEPHRLFVKPETVHAS